MINQPFSNFHLGLILNSPSILAQLIFCLNFLGSQLRKMLVPLKQKLLTLKLECQQTTLLTSLARYICRNHSKSNMRLCFQESQIHASNVRNSTIWLIFALFLRRGQRNNNWIGKELEDVIKKRTCNNSNDQQEECVKSSKPPKSLKQISTWQEGVMNNPRKRFFLCPLKVLPNFVPS